MSRPAMPPGKPSIPAARFLLQSLLLASLAFNAQAFAADDAEALVNKANQFAGQSDYAQAIPLYEQAIKKLPNEAVLKKNVAVLCVNYGYELQDKKDYAGAMSYFDKALGYLPTSKEAKTGKAANYFYQALDLQETNAGDYAGRRALLEKSVSLAPEQANFKKALAATYLEEGYELASAERFKEAEPVLQKGLTYEPDNKNLRQSLANVYLGMARDDAANRKALADKALAIDSSPRIKQTYDNLLAAGASPIKPGDGGGFTAAPSDVKAKAPKEIAELSVAEMLNAVEKQLSLEPAKDATLMDRLEAAEKQVLGKPGKGPMAVRAKEVYTSLMGSYGDSYTQSNVGLVQSPVTDSNSNYLAEVFKATDGKVVRWGKFPIRVYIEEPGKDVALRDENGKLKDAPLSDGNLYLPEFREAALEGLNVWKNSTNGWVNFVEVKNRDSADVVVKWQDKYEDRFADPETAPDFYKNYTPPKRTGMMRAVQIASMLTPGYYSLAPQALNAMMQYKQYKKMDVLREESEIRLGLEPTKALGPEAAKLLVQNMAAKEFGHALGLKGSSPVQGDLLYPELKTDAVQTPSARDLETLRQLYERPPNIILNVN